MVDAASADPGKDKLDERGDEKTGSEGHEEKTELAGVGRRPEREHLKPTDGHAKAHHQKAGDDSDENREHQKEVFIAVRRQLLNIGRIGRVGFRRLLLLDVHARVFLQLGHLSSTASGACAIFNSSASSPDGDPQTCCCNHFGVVNELDFRLGQVRIIFERGNR